MFKKAKKSIAWLAILALAFTIFAGYFASIQFAEATTAGPLALFTGQPVASKVEYGGTFSVPAVTGGVKKVTVKAPNATTATINSNTVTANQLGIYEVTVESTHSQGGFYKYNVRCYLDGDYILVVDKSGAIIPSYWKLGDGTSNIKLPDANVYKYDEDAEEYVKDYSQDLNIRVTDPKGNVTNYLVDKSTDTVSKNGGAAVAVADDFVTELNLNEKGKWFFTYYTHIEGETNIISEEFITQVQVQFEDEKAPTLSVSGVPSTASVNTKVTLPTATASDNYDSRVIVDISVKHKYGDGDPVDVPMTIIDKKTGYVTTDSDKFRSADDETVATGNVANAAAAVFDNNRFMYFYPTETGTYTVTYQAQDTSKFYGINSKNASVQYVYTINVTDTTAPVFDSIDDYKIPTSWGSEVYMDNGTTEGLEFEAAGKSKNINFPIPEVYDNNDKPEDITVRFNFTDNNGRTVAYFENINSTEAGDENKYMPAANLTAIDGKPYYFFRHNTNYDVAANGAITRKGSSEVIGYDFPTVFNFDLWNPDYTGATKNTTYSVVYSAYDNAGARNFQAKSYSIAYSAEYKDLIAPDVYFEAPKYLSFTENEEEVAITGVSVTDSSSSRLNDEYYIVFNVADGSYTKDNFDAIIAGNDKIKLDSSMGSNILKVQHDGSFKVTTKNDDGEDQTVENIDPAKYIYVAVRATDSVGNQKVRVQRLTAVNATSTVTGKTCTVSSNGYYGRDNTGAANYTLNQANAQKGDLYVLGNFRVKFAATADREHTGFELYVQKIAMKDGTPVATEETPLTNVAFETYSVNDGSDLNVYIDNVRFTPSSTGLYMVVVRGYHISGHSDVSIAYVEADGVDSDDDIIQKNASIQEKGDINTTYSLKSEFSGKAGSYVVTSVSGGRMSLMFDKFVAMTKTTYSFKDYTVMPSAAKSNLGYISYDYTTSATQPVPSCRPLDDDTKTAPASKTNYSMQANDKEAPVIRLQEVMPVYAAKSATTRLSLPPVSATSLNGIAAQLTCKITDFDGNTVSTKAGTGNSFSFLPEKDGVYTVTYTATLNSNVTTETYSISVGDVVPPTFNIINYGITGALGEHIIGYIQDKIVLSNQSSSITATVGDTFKFAYIDVNKETDPSTSGYTYLKQLKDASGEIVDSTTSYSSRGNTMTFTMSGQYEVIYRVTDEYNNATEVKYTITVTSSTINVSTEAITTLSIVLIIVGVILVAGVVIYLVRFRKHKRA